MTNSNNTRVGVAVLLLIAALVLPTGSARAQRPDTCLGGTLAPSTPAGSDLVVKVDCTVGAGTYKFGNVNILAGGTLRFTDAKIDFWAANILVESGGSLIAGLPDPIGTNGGVVTIHLYGKDQTGQNPDMPGKGITCLSDRERCGVPKDIWESNVDSGSHNPVSPERARKISAMSSATDYLGVKDDYFYPYHPLPVDGADMQGYFGYKVLAVSYGATLQLFGKKGATYGPTGECGEAAPSTSGTSWARLNATARKGTQTLTVDRKLFLKDGDQIVVTTTDYLPGHSEQLTVAGDVNCGTSIALKEALQYDHNGVRYPLTAVPENFGLDPKLRSDGAETRAAVALLSRNIRIVSAGDTLNDDFPLPPPPKSPDAGYFFGGHMIVRQGFKTFQVQGVEFYQMGQGGRLGHYPVHFHHARKTPPDTFVKDSSIHDSMTRWIVLHGTQDVTLARNVGYKSIGHGFYLEDGTEINNTLIANLGIFARAAVDNIQNPRKVPGILAAPNLHGGPGDDYPHRSDYNNPTVFWIMNGWNDFQDNMAAGAGTCGACYWLVPGFNSGLSKASVWESYASMQSVRERAGMTPLKSFVGNSCTSAMTSFQTVARTEPCLGVQTTGGTPTLPPVLNPLAATAPDDSYYPSIDTGGMRFATRCGGPNADPSADCSSTPPRCAAGVGGSPPGPDCMITVLDRYTTSFNWAALNFAAIWLRPQWYLVTNSVITDVQQAGLTMVTGGGYTAGDVVPGHWALVQKSVFIGNTQDCPTCEIKDNPFASNGGPFNPSGLRCAQNAQGSREQNYCASIDEGVSHQSTAFGMYQRLFSIYDGPAFQDSNAYLNITPRKIDDCSPFVGFSTFDNSPSNGRCEPKNHDKGVQSAWLAGFVQGLPKARPDVNDANQDFCYMPNAAIGWKQPNGFYYPPALHSKNLFFKDVDIRHFVVTPLFAEGTLTADTGRIKDEYCNWNEGLFNSFTSIDRQTVLNDDDGTLTGFKGTTVINLDDFFHAPVEAIQCQSDNTSVTSPYQYLTTVVYPKCLTDGSCQNWDKTCTNPSCSGVALYRQDLMPESDKDPKKKQTVAKSIRMMGQNTGQRSTLTVNRGTYYLDTALDFNSNLFQAEQTYYLFLIYAREDAEQTYRFYVGENSDFDLASIQMVQAHIAPDPVLFQNFQPLPKCDPGSRDCRARWLGNNKATAKGVVEVLLKVSDFPGVAEKFKTAREKKCQPATYCTWNASKDRCEDASGSDAVCRWAIAHPECPEGGCIGIVFKLPAGFKTLADSAIPRPPAVCLSKAAPWDVSFQDLTVSDGVCPKASDTLAPDFCR
jgi:G8 domain